MLDSSIVDGFTVRDDDDKMRLVLPRSLASSKSIVIYYCSRNPSLLLSTGGVTILTSATRAEEMEKE